MKNEYEIIIGMEVHVQLETEEKLLCACRPQFGAPLNSRTCAICLGQGGEPKLNPQALEQALKAVLALHCEVATVLKFDRKHYSADDLPKGYQATQNRQPLGQGGYVEIEWEEGEGRIPLLEAHLEEDAGRTVQSDGGAVIDFNRAGMPLLEIVTPPVFRSGEEVRAYLEALQLLLRYTGVSNARIEEGSIRCEPNVSLRLRGSTSMGVPCEVKNIASLSGVVSAIHFESERQAALLSAGQPVLRETRRWDEKAKATFAMRSKETAADYRYEPEPLLPAQVIEGEYVERLKGELPELPAARRQRYRQDYALSPYQARQLVQDEELAAYFEETLGHFTEPQTVVNWLLTELRSLLNAHGKSFAACPVSPQDLAELLKLVAQGELSHNAAKELLAEGFSLGRPPALLAQERGLRLVTDESVLGPLIEQVLATEKRAVGEYLAGKTRVLGFLVGRVMALSKGLAEPRLVQDLLVAALATLKE